MPSFDKGQNEAPRPLQSIGLLGRRPPQQFHTEQSLRAYTDRLAPSLQNLTDAQHYSPNLGIDINMANRMYGWENPLAQPPADLPQQPPLAAIGNQPPLSGEGWYSDPNSPVAAWTGAGTNNFTRPPISGEGWYSDPNSPVAQWTGANNNISGQISGGENWGATGMFGGNISS